MNIDIRQAEALVDHLEELQKAFGNDPEALGLLEQLGQQPAALRARLVLEQQRSQERLLRIQEYIERIRRMEEALDDARAALQSAFYHIPEGCADEQKVVSALGAIEQALALKED